jgi:methionyl aminopeptidase
MTSHWTKYIKTEKEIAIMRENGAILAKILADIKDMVKPELNTMDLEKEFIRLCKKHGVRPACKGFDPYGMDPYPTGLCLSINADSVHCYPKKTKTIHEGDIVTIDTVIEKDDMYVDAAVSLTVGKSSDKRKKMVQIAEASVMEAIKKVKDGARIGDISNAMHTVVKSAGFEVLRDYAGHGIGSEMHEYPEIPCYGREGTGDTLYAGMTICIESLVCEGNPAITYKNEWETSMRDGKDWVQFEHTVLVTKDGYEIITTR